MKLDYSQFLQLVRSTLTLHEDVELELSGKLADYNVTSIAFIELVVALEQTYGVEFADGDLNLARYETLGDIWRAMTRSMSRQSMGPNQSGEEK